MNWEAKRAGDLEPGYYWYMATNWRPCIVRVQRHMQEGTMIEFFGVLKTFHLDELEKFNPQWKGPLSHD